MSRFPMKCTQCDAIVERNKMPFHIRQFHGPVGSRNRNAPVQPAQQPLPAASWGLQAREAPPPPDVQEDRKSFKANIQEIVREFDALPVQAIEECSVSTGDMPVLGALYAYTFTHLKLCAPTKKSLLDDLEKLKTGWIKQGDACLLDLKTMKVALVRILQKSQVKEHICNTRLINTHRLHDLDINNIAALVVERTTSEEHAHSFYAVADDKAQYMVDTLQNLLVLQSEDVEKYRKYLLNAIIKLSRKSGRFPQSLQLRQIKDLKKTKFRGGYGVILQGKLDGRVVAVKEVEVVSRPLEQFLKEFANEAVVWCYIRHPNCLPFYGVVDEGARKCLVAPWMENGHVRDYLKANPDTDRLPLILDVACGLECLHSMQPKVIHGDLKGVNILITSSGRACLADFGIVTVQDPNVQMTTATFNVRGTRYFMAPELLRAESNDDLKNLDRCDMYAFGCVCYEMYTGMVPFENLNALNILKAIVLDKCRPQRPSDPIQGLDDDMWGFIEASWGDDPMARPTAAGAYMWILSKMESEGKDTVRPHAEAGQWDVGFLVDGTVTMAAEDPFALART